MLRSAIVRLVRSVNLVDRCTWWKKDYNPGVAGDHMFNTTEAFLIGYHDKEHGNKKQLWQCNFERDQEHDAALKKNADIQIAVNRVEAAEKAGEHLDEGTVSLSEELPIEVDEQYQRVRARMFAFEVPSDKLKDGAGKVCTYEHVHTIPSQFQLNGFVHNIFTIML